MGRVIPLLATLFLQGMLDGVCQDGACPDEDAAVHHRVALLDADVSVVLSRKWMWAQHVVRVSFAIFRRKEGDDAACAADRHFFEKVVDYADFCRIDYVHLNWRLWWLWILFWV